MPGTFANKQYTSKTKILTDRKTFLFPTHSSTQTEIWLPTLIYQHLLWNQTRWTLIWANASINHQGHLATSGHYMSGGWLWSLSHTITLPFTVYSFALQRKSIRLAQPHRSLAQLDLRLSFISMNLYPSTSACLFPCRDVTKNAEK